VLDYPFDDSLCDVLSNRGCNFLVRGAALERDKVLDAVMLDDLKRSRGAMLNWSQWKKSVSFKPQISTWNDRSRRASRGPRRTAIIFSAASIAEDLAS